MPQFMYFWSWLFSPYIGTALFVLLALWLITKKRTLDAMMVATSGIATAVAVVILKDIVQRPRPRVDSALWATDASFPSGHAAGVACFAILTWWFLVPKSKRSLVAPVFPVIAAFVGASRLYFGVHYVSDILAGYAIGAIIAVLAILFDRSTKST